MAQHVPRDSVSLDIQSARLEGGKPRDERIEIRRDDEAMLGKRVCHPRSQRPVAVALPVSVPQRYEVLNHRVG